MKIFQANEGVPGPQPVRHSPRAGRKRAWLSAGSLVFALALVPATLSAGPLPTAIPAPNFGLQEMPGQPTHFVNNTIALATDWNNPLGTPSRPRLTVPSVIPAGAVVQIAGGPYSIKSMTWTSNGTQASPSFVVGVGGPVFQGDRSATTLRLAGSFLVVDGVVLDGAALTIVGSAMAFRNGEVRNHVGTAVAVIGVATVLYKNHIHHNGDANNPVEFDAHGVKVAPGSLASYILENDIHHNGGDGIQVGEARSSEPWARYVFIGGNRFHEDRENGVDIKQSRDVIVSQNFIYGYIARSSSAGEAVVVHDGAERVWIVNNAVGASEQGIVCTGAKGYIVAGNVIVGIRHRPGAPYSASNVWGTSGILTYSSIDAVHVNNTIWGSDAGISIAGGGAGTAILNNIIGGLTEPTVAIRFNSSTTRQASAVSNNFTGANPGFLNPAAWDFRFSSGSPLSQGGLSHPVSEAYLQHYGILLDRDIYGGIRAFEGLTSIGAAQPQ